MTKQEYRIVTMILVFVIIVLGSILASIPEKTPITLSDAFNVIDTFSSQGYIVTTFYVFEDDSSIPVYMLFAENGKLIYQFPDWTIGEYLG